MQFSAFGSIYTPGAWQAIVLRPTNLAEYVDTNLATTCCHGSIKMHVYIVALLLVPQLLGFKIKISCHQLDKF